VIYQPVKSPRGLHHPLRKPRRCACCESAVRRGGVGPILGLYLEVHPPGPRRTVGVQRRGQPRRGAVDARQRPRPRVCRRHFGAVLMLALHNHLSVWPILPVTLGWSRHRMSPRGRAVFYEAIGRPMPPESWGGIHWVEQGADRYGRRVWSTTLHFGRLRIIFGNKRVIPPHSSQFVSGGLTLHDSSS